MFNFAPPQIEMSALMPVLIVALTGVLTLLVETISPKRNNNLVVGVSLAGLIVAAIAVFFQFGYPEFDTAAGTVRSDALGRSLQLVVILGTGLSVLFSEPYLRARRIPFGEFYPLVLWSSVGAMLLCITTHLLMIFLGVEILSIALYVMAGMNKGSEASNESALKYFLLGSFASGFLLYGIAFVYGATGGLNLEGIQMTWARNLGESRTLLVFGMGLMLVGLSFKTSLVPFHQWTPDVYQGAPTNASAFMATVSKVGALAALWRLLDATTLLQSLWVPAVGAIAVLTIIVGNVLALAQRDVKRILGYSSIAHAGYMLVAILAHVRNPGAVGPNTLVYYLLSYTLMTVGAFAVLSLTARDGQEGTSLEDLNGLWQRSPIGAACLVVCLLSLIGIPPLSGFFAKAAIFVDALRGNLVGLAIVLAIGSVISVYYYLRIALAVFATESAEAQPTPLRASTPVTLAYVLCAAGVLVIALFYAPIMNAFGLGSPSVAPTAVHRASASSLSAANLP